MSQDLEHLKLLSIFHYVVAGLAGLFSLIPVVHLVIGVGLATGTLEPEDAAARVVGWFFVAFAGAFILAGLTFAVCLAVAGRFLARRQHYTYCLVMAAVACIFMPFGTVLGVFTIIVLVRESVKELFARAPGGGEAPAANEGGI